MCDRCRRAFLPTNHPKSNGFAAFGDRFHIERVRAIKNPLAEMRRQARMGVVPSMSNGERYGGHAYWREWIAKFRGKQEASRG